MKHIEVHISVWVREGFVVLENSNWWYLWIFYIPFLVKTWCKPWVIVGMLDMKVWEGVVILYIQRWSVWLILGRLVIIVLGCWVRIIIVCLCNVCSMVRRMLCWCRSPQWRDAWEYLLCFWGCCIYLLVSLLRTLSKIWLSGLKKGTAY